MLFVDECMSAWRGQEQYLKDALGVHITKIARKPEGVGIEVKASADGSSGILLRLEIHEGQRSNRPRLYEDRLPFHSAIVLRLTDPWRGTGRTIVADAAFGSVRTALEVEKLGNHFMGVVKTATKGYPKQVFKAWGSSDRERGEHKVLTATVEGVNVISLGRYAKPGLVKTFVATTGVTIPGEPITVKRTYRLVRDGTVVTEKRDKTTPRPKLVEDLFKHFGVIDFHDRLRQGYLKLEKIYLTKVWWRRLFTTVFGICVVDAYLVYVYEYKLVRGQNEDGMLNLFEFVDKLSYSLIHYSDPVSGSIRGRRDVAAVVVSAFPCKIQIVRNLSE